MNTQTNKPTKRIPHVRVLSTLAALCLIEFLIANVAFAQVKYSPFNYPDAMGGSWGPTGVRSAGGQDVYITGSVHPTPPPTPTPSCFVGSHGLLYKGPPSGNGSWTVLDYPFSPLGPVTGTVLYGPDNLPPNNVRIVGSYTICNDPGGTRNHGLLYEGPTNGSGTWQTIDFPISAATPSPSPGEQVLNTIVHSTMGGLAVGNFDTNLLTGRAFVYDIAANSWKELIKPSVSITAYGIWYNGGTSYTIAGGYSDANPNGIDHGYLAHWDSATQTASDWTPYDFDNGRIHVEVSHFDGITTDNRGGFYLTGEWAGGLQLGGFFAHVPRMPHRAFGNARWRDIEYPSSPGLDVLITTGNTVFENTVFGIYVYTVNGNPTFNGYIANVQGHR